MCGFVQVYERLYEAYGPQGWWPLLREGPDGLKCSYEPENSIKELNYKERFEICAGAILTQNTNWGNAERALVSLANAGLLDAGRLSAAETGLIADCIRTSGYYNQKAKKLKNFAGFYLGNPPPDRKLFLAQWGLGPETVDDMLLYAYNQPVFVVDAYTTRLFSRLGLCDAGISYHDLQAEIMNSLEKDVLMFKEYHALIVRHAKEHCSKKPVCAGCPLAAVCPGAELSQKQAE
jgi:HhH-GPD superfamily base excision DNA repair protein.